MNSIDTASQSWDFRQRLQQWSWQKVVCLMLLLAINCLFVSKYTMRVTSSYGFIVVAYMLFLSAMGCCLLLSDTFVKKVKTWHCGMLIGVGALVMLAIQYHFDPMQNAVDRWSAIENPIRYLLRGGFPYLAPTHLDGKASPFPMWQVFHIPFYFLGNVGLSEPFSIVCFLGSIWYLYDYKRAFVASMFTFFSIAILYEVSVRSDLITNFMLLSAFINFIHKRGITFGKRPFVLAFIAGLWLSTRLHTALPLFILFFPEWLKLTNTRKVLSPMIAAATLVITFLPFYLWNADALLFDSTSPFVLQTRQGGMLEMLITFGIVVLLVVLYIKGGKRFADYNLCAAMALIGLTAVAFVVKMAADNSFDQIFEGAYDITYFNAALPFIITGMVDNSQCRMLNAECKKQKP